jgi:hypothetical protein
MLTSPLPLVCVLFSYLLFLTYTLLIRQEDMIFNLSNDSVNCPFANPLCHFSHPPPSRLSFHDPSLAHLCTPLTFQCCNCKFNSSHLLLNHIKHLVLLQCWGTVSKPGTFTFTPLPNIKITLTKESVCNMESPASEGLLASKGDRDADEDKDEVEESEDIVHKWHCL